MRSGEIDIGVIIAAKEREDVVAEPFGDDELILITPATDPWPQGDTLPLAELKAMPLIVLGAGSATRGSLEQALAVAKTRLGDLKVVAELGRTGAIKEAVKQGYGVAFVYKRAVASEIAAGILRTATVPELRTIMLPLTTVYERRRELSPTTRAFLEYLRNAAPGAKG